VKGGIFVACLDAFALSLDFCEGGVAVKRSNFVGERRPSIRDRPQEEEEEEEEEGRVTLTKASSSHFAFCFSLLSRPTHFSTGETRFLSLSTLRKGD